MIDYCTVAELKDYVRIPDDLDDSVLTLAITTASRAIDQACGRSFDPQLTVAEERFYEANGRRVEIDDLFTTDGLVVEGSPVLTGRDPYTALTFRTRVHGVLSVTAKFGWPEVPSSIKQATLMQASRFLIRRESPYGVAGSPDAGTEIRLLARLDPDVAVAIRPYYRWWAVAPKGLDSSPYSVPGNEVAVWI